MIAQETFQSKYFVIFIYGNFNQTKTSRFNRQD